MEKFLFTNASFLEGFEYDDKTERLTVLFKNGKSYEYKDVPKEVVEDFKTAESAGSYFANHIKNTYETV